MVCLCYLLVEMKRTPTQNSAMWLFCEELADALNDGGYETKAVLAVKEVDVPWNKELIMELLFRPLMKAMTGKTSTTELERLEMSEVYEVLNRHIAEKFGVSVAWPTRGME